jgi:hypothetical protein
MIIHISDWADQPSVRVKCTQTWGSPTWAGDPKHVKGLPEGVYSLDISDKPDAVLYTFESDKVTCPACKS